ncbi:glycosyltransferase family 4 protein [Patescibacteria group bacterium]|nr:glycosyltransferase family 4 protein [Patescibacteria group bacterium]
MSAKIIIDARFIAGGDGLARYTYKLLEYLLKIDQENDYKILVYKQDVGMIDFDYGNYVVEGVDFVHYSMAEQWGMLNYLNKQKPDLVHFSNFNHPIMYRGKFITTVHDITLLFYPGNVRRKFIAQYGYKVAMQSAMKNSTKVIAVTDYTKREILKYFGGKDENVEIIYEAINDKFVRENNQNKIDIVKKKYKVNKPYFLYLGQWRVHKNLVNLVNAFDLVKSEGLDMQLVIIGKEDRRYPEVRERIAVSPHRDDIIITGWIEDDEVPALFTGANSFVFPSLYEGFGFTPLEAMQSGVPVVSSNASCLPEVLGDAVVYFDPLNIDDMKKAMQKIAKDEDLRKELVKKGYGQVGKYSWDKMARETLDVYNEVLGV